LKPVLKVKNPMMPNLQFTSKYKTTNKCSEQDFHLKTISHLTSFSSMSFNAATKVSISKMVW